MLKGFGINLIEGLLNGISETWHTITDFFSGVLEDLKTFFSDTWDSITQFASDALAAIQTTWETAGEWFNTNVVQPITEFFTKLWEDIVQFASDAWDGIVEIWELVSGWFDENVIQPISKFFEDMWNGIGQLASDIWDAIVKVWVGASKWFKENVTDPLGDAFEAVGEFIKGVFNGIIGNVEGMINAVIKAVNWIISKINTLSIDIPDNPITGPVKLGFNIPTIPEASLPRLAQGAVIPPNREFLAVLGDQRSGNNLEGPESAFENAVIRGMQKAGSIGGNRPITVILQVDRRELGRIVYEVNNEETQRVGVRLTEVRG